MTWRKAPRALIDLFDRVIPDDRRIARRRMFGYPAVFVNGNLFAGLHQESFILRLSEADRARARTEHGADTFEPMAGRPMREYVALPEALLSDRGALGDWIARSLAYGASLPRKQKKPRKPKRAK